MIYTNQFICGNDGDALDVSTIATSNWTNPTDWLYDAFTGGVGKNDAGVSVNGYTALMHCPLWQGVNIIAGDLAQVPIRLVKDDFNDQKTHNAWNLLRIEPNELQTPLLFIETLMQWALVWGNGVAWTPRAGSRITELIPLRPDCLWYELVGYEGSQTILYHYNSPVAARTYTFFPYEVLHIQGLTGDGIWGYPLWQIAKNTIGFGLALQKHGNKQFANGARPSGVLEHPAKLGDEARKHLREEWQKVHGGSNNSGKIAILWEGMKFNPISMSNIDAQWAEAIDLSAIDAARLLNLPAYKLNYTKDSSTRANLEEQNETYKQMTLTRWATKLDQEFRRKLLTDSEWRSDRYQFVFDWDAFMRADIDTLTQVGDRCVKGEIMNRNEARRLLRLPPYPGGDMFGSPAINPQRQNTPEDGADSPNNGRPRNTVFNRLCASETAHRELLLDRMLHFIERESISLKQAAGSSKNFIRWLDEFYVGVDANDPKIVPLCEAIMGASIRACCAAGLDARGIVVTISGYAKKRHAQLLEACSDVTKGELPATIEKLAVTDQSLIAQGLLATALAGAQYYEGEA